MSSEQDPRRPLDGILDGLAESVASESPVELLEESRSAGHDSKMIAERVKITLQAALKKFEQRRLEAARETCRLHAASRSGKSDRIPSTAEERMRQLFSILESNPAIGAALTTQHRSFEMLSDSDVESALEDLAELGLLDHLSEPPNER